MANPDFGVREFINLLVIALEFYLRHKANIDENLEPQTKSNLESLAGVLNSLRAMNIPGPNPVVPDQSSGGL